MRYWMAVVAISVLPAWSAAQGEAKKPLPSYAKVEIRGVLGVTGTPRKIQTFDNVFASSAAWVVYESAKDTGVAIESPLGKVAVYVGDDIKTIELAKRLHGKAVVLCGDLRHVTLMPNHMLGAPPQAAFAPHVFMTGAQSMLLVRPTSIKAAE